MTTSAALGTAHTEKKQTLSATQAVFFVFNLQRVEQQKQAEEVVEVAVPKLDRVLERWVVLAHPRDTKHAAKPSNLTSSERENR